MALLIFLGVTAFVGGVAMVFGVAAAVMLPSHWLESLPLVTSWTVPGLILGLGFGVGSLVVAYGLARLPKWPALAWLSRATGRHWAWLGAILIGVGMLVWVSLQLVWFADRSVLQLIYGALGLALVVLPNLPAARSYVRSL